MVATAGSDRREQLTVLILMHRTALWMRLYLMTDSSPTLWQKLNSYAGCAELTSLEMTQSAVCLGRLFSTVVQLVASPRELVATKAMQIMQFCASHIWVGGELSLG